MSRTMYIKLHTFQLPKAKKKNSSETQSKRLLDVLARCQIVNNDSVGDRHQAHLSSSEAASVCYYRDFFEPNVATLMFQHKGGQINSVLNAIYSI